MDILGVPMDKLGVHMYKSYEDVIYVSTTLVVHGPCTHGSHLAGAEYFREADCSTVLYGNSTSSYKYREYSKRSKTREETVSSLERVVVQ